MADGLGKHTGHRQILDLVAICAGLSGDGIQEDDLIQHAVVDALDGGAGQHTVRSTGGHVLGTADLHQSLGGMAQRSAGVHHVVQQDDVLVLHFTDDVHDLGGVGLLTALVHDSHGHIQLLSESTGTGHGAYVGRNHHGFLMHSGKLTEEVIHKDGGTQQVVHRDVKETLNLVGVQVHGQHAVSAGGGDHVGNQLGGDGIAGLGLAVLTGIAEVRNDGGDAAGRSALERVDHNEQLHQGVVHGTGLAILVHKGTGGLNHEHVGATDGLINRSKVLAIGEGANLTGSQRNTQLTANVLCQLGIGAAGKNLDVLSTRNHFLHPP